MWGRERAALAGVSDELMQHHCYWWDCVPDQSNFRTLEHGIAFGGASRQLFAH